MWTSTLGHQEIFCCSNRSSWLPDGESEECRAPEEKGKTESKPIRRVSVEEILKEVPGVFLASELGKENKKPGRMN